MDKRIRYLDGLRAISIIMVLIGHGGHSINIPKWIGFFLGSSHLGVMIFFNISGFLITTLLLKELSTNGKISLTSFYKRRMLRIFPVFYSYLIIIGLLAYFHYLDMDKHFFVFASIHLWNYMEAIRSFESGIDYWYLGHLWTLALEEQFYFLWPILLYLFNAKKMTKILPFVLFIFPFIRFSSYFIFPNLRGQIGMMLHTMGDSIFWGSYAAMLVHFDKEFVIEKIKKLQKSGILFLLFLFVYIFSSILGDLYQGSYSITIGFSLESISISILILYLTQLKPIQFGFLNNRYLVYIGKLSYSLYIWQQLFLAPLGNSVHFNFPFNFILCIAAAFISFNTIERLGLYIKSKL